MRRLQLVGVVRPRAKAAQIARRCAWCGKWDSVEDYIAAHQDNAKVTHGICQSCERKFMGKLESPTPPSAA